MASPTQWTCFEQDSGAGDGRERLAHGSPWGCKELDMTEQLKNAMTLRLPFVHLRSLHLKLYP